MQGRLSTRPNRVSNIEQLRQIGGSKLLNYGSGGLVFIPSTTNRHARLPLLVMLHGATHSARDAIMVVQSAAKERGFMVFAPKSQGRTWDIIVRRGFGPDFMAINDALDRLPVDYPIDPANIAIGGFSDGASYALTLGLLNGDIFRTVLAFSPGFSIAEQIIGRPKIYISHGRSDRVLPYDRCGSALAHTLSAIRLDVHFDPFEGGHCVPFAQATAAADWWLGN